MPRPWPLLLLLAGCMVGPDFKPPHPNAPAAWRNDRGSAGLVASDPDPAWWEGFNDPTLTHLIALGLQQNPDLKESLLRVIESREQIVAARAAALPQLGGSASYAYEQLGLRGLLKYLGVPQRLNQLASSGSPADLVKPGLGGASAAQINQLLNEVEAPTPSYQYGLDASWELDLFGRVRRGIEAARAAADAQADAADDAQVMLEAEIGRSYLELRLAQMQLSAEQDAVQIAGDLVSLTTRRQSLGLASQLDLDQAQTQLLDAEAALPGYQQAAQQAIDALDMLTGNDPGTLDAILSPPAPLPATPTLIGIGLPASLARRRPDVRAAEAELHAATADTGVAVASFYPDVSLLGNAGLQALNVNYLASWESVVFSAGPQISLPIFQGGRLSADLRMAKANQQAAALSYRSTVLNALREVEDALTAYGTDTITRARTDATYQVASRTYHLAQARYTLGLASFLQVLDAEQTLIAQQQKLAQADFAVTNDVVTLYTALGGGWQQSRVRLPAPAIEAAPPPLPAAADRLADPG